MTYSYTDKVKVNVNGYTITKFRMPGADKLPDSALKSHDSHMYLRTKALDSNDPLKTRYAKYRYHTTVARLIVRFKRELTPKEKASAWNSRLKRFG